MAPQIAGIWHLKFRESGTPISILIHKLSQVLVKRDISRTALHIVLNKIIENLYF